jgi:mRNA interferase RelE/StbE
VTANPYTIRLAPKAAAEIRALTPKQRKLALRLADALSVNPRPPGAEKITGMTGLYSESANGLRLIYKIEEQSVILLFIRGLAF